MEWSSSGCPADALGTYLRLGDPHAAIRKRLGEDPTLFDAVHRFPGLRLVKNDPWECLANFLTSMVKSVGEIENCAERLARACGERTPDGVWRFPEPGVVARADEGKLRRLTGIGFRARYLRAAGLAVDRGDVDLAGLERAAYGDAVEALMALDGVGRKVADCVALYGLGKLEAFPVDTHVRRAMERSLFRAKKQPYDAISDLAAARWGPLAGYAQQWLFHSERLARRRPPPEGPRSNP